MSGTWFLARAEVRARWKAWLSIALLLGIFGGATAAAAAGARRTDTAYPRYLEASRSFDVFVADFSFFAPLFWKPDLEMLEQLPYVEQIAEARYFFQANDDQILSPVDGVLGRDVNRLTMVRGREATGVHEVMIPFSWEREPPVDVGDTVTLAFDPPITVEVVGVYAMPGYFPPLDLLSGSFLTSKAFYERYGQQFESIEAAFLRFRNGAADRPRFDADISRLTGGMVFEPLRNDEHAANVQRSFHLQAVALWFLAAGVGLGAAVVLGQTIARQVGLEMTDRETLRSLGMSRSNVLVASLIRVGGTGLAGGIIAALVGFAASPLFPRGLARLAEPSPGLAFDGVVAALVLAGTVAVALVSSVVPLLRTGRVGDQHERARRPSRATGLLARAGLPPASVAGARFALEPGRGRQAVPVRSSIAALSLGLAALVAAFTFGSNLDHLLATPRLYGLGWDIGYGFESEDSSPPEAARRAAVEDPSVAAVAVGTAGIPMDVATRDDPTRIPLSALTVGAFLKDSIVPEPIDGRLPTVDEVLLGPHVMDRLGIEVGDEVLLGLQGGPQVPTRVSGVGVIPPLKESAKFGEGLLLVGVPPSRYLPSSYQGPTPPDDTLFVRFRDGLDETVAKERLRTKLDQVSYDFTLPQTNDLINFGRVQSMPLALAGMLATLAAAVLAHLLVTAIRQRRRDIAVLRTIGFRGRQARATVAWQASLTVITAAVVGVPFGLIGGRWLWSVFARDLGVLVEHRTPWVAIGVIVPAAVLVANLIAVLPARAAARARPAPVLRTE